jgi:hypothetical protein
MITVCPNALPLVGFRWADYVELTRLLIARGLPLA